MKDIVLKILNAGMLAAFWVLRRVDYYFGQTMVSLDPAEALGKLVEAIDRASRLDSDFELGRELGTSDRNRKEMCR